MAWGADYLCSDCGSTIYKYHVYIRGSDSKMQWRYGLERCTFYSLIGCAFRTGSLGVHWFIGTRNDRWTDGGIHDGRAYEGSSGGKMK